MASIEAFLSSLERPETVLPQLVKEMADAAADAARAEAKAMTAVAADRRRLDAANGRVSRLAQGARLALRAKDEDTARQALAAQIRAERDVGRCAENVERSELAYQNARRARGSLQGQLRELKARKRELLARVQSLREKETVSQPKPVALDKKARCILDVVSRLETRLQEEETELEVHDQIRRTLGATFEHERVIEMENDAEVDRRLEELRREAGPDVSDDN